MDYRHNLTNFYRTLHNDYQIPPHNESYLRGIKSLYNFNPTVIYDIGSAVLHWTKFGKQIWPESQIIAFEAVKEVGEFYTEYGIDYHLDVLGDEDNKEITFYEHPIYLGGNSFYKENVKYSPIADSIYDEEHSVKRNMRTIDSIVKERNFPLPELIKIDVQGCELDILKGMTETLKNVQHIIVELQTVEYNIGAKTVVDSIPFIESLGFKLQPVNLINVGDMNPYFCGNGPDADYHFMKI
jgi:hypothetical protein